MTAQTHYVVERPEPDSYEVEHGERHRATWSSWSPAQFVGLVVGIAITVMGFVALARTGFDTASLNVLYEFFENDKHETITKKMQLSNRVTLGKSR